MNPNETLAVHIFENSNADPNASSSVGALGLAQIYDKFAASSTNPRGWARFAQRWNLRGSKAPISDSLKRNPEFAIDYLAWRMAGTRGRYAPSPEGLDAWYRSGGYNPGFKGDRRGPGPSIYVSDNPQSRSASENVVPFPVAGYGLGDVSSVWGDPRDGGSRSHEGVDIAAPHGTPLVAVADGVIRLAYGGAGGNQIFINNTYYYAHLSRFNVRNGQRVKRGQIIGYVGSTGTSSSGPHLHFSIFRNGKAVDPMRFLRGAVSGEGGVESDVGFDAAPDAFDMFFPDQSPIPLPAGGPGLPAGGPGLPGIDSHPGLGFERRDMTSTWRLIANQEDVGEETLRLAGMGEEPL